MAGTFSNRTATVPRTVLSMTTLTPAICASASISTRASAREAGEAGPPLIALTGSGLKALR